MINQRLSTSEAAARLGVKTETLYAYVSRGLLHPDRSGRGSTFDAHEVAQLARTGRHPRRSGPSPVRGASGGRSGPEPGSGDPVFLTELALIEGGRLYYRGLDAVSLSRSRSFEDTATWLWTGEWAADEAGGAAASYGTASGGAGGWTVPSGAVELVRRALAGLTAGATPLERFMLAVVTASLADDLRHDLTPAGVVVTGRGILAVLAMALPLAGDDDRSEGAGGLSRRVWRGLTPPAARADAAAVGDPAGVSALEAALVLAADHELAPSTLAARVAASFRADPYAVVLTGLGPASGSWSAGGTGAPTEVESLLEEAAAVGPERAIGERLRRTGETPHGFGMPLYPDGDPRGRELLSRLEGVGDPRRLEVVGRVVELGRERGFPPPNFDLGLGALSFCAGMMPGAGQAIFTLGKVAGWLAHAVEEYGAPTRFRSRADYVGPLPEGTPAP